MGTIRRQSIQATLILGIGVLLGFVLRLFLFTKFLSVTEIGLITVLLDTANIFAAFIPLGSQSIFVKYMPFFKEGSATTPRGLLFLGGMLSLIGFLIFVFAFLIFKSDIINFYKDQAPLFAQYIYFMIPLVLARVIFTVGQSYARALKRNVFPLVIKEILVRILTGILVIAFAANWFDLDGLVLWFVVIYFVSGSIMTLYLSRLGFMDFRPAFSKFRGGRGKEIFYFGLFAIMSSTGEILIRNVDSLMLTSLAGLPAAGIYSIAFFIGQIIEMPRRAISQITAPFVAEAAAKENTKKIATLYHKSSVNQFLAGSLLLICVWTNIDSLLQIIPNGEDYESGKYVVLFIGLGKLFDMSMGINGNIIQNSPYYRFNFYSLTLLGVLAIVTNLVLIPTLGINGAAIASLISISVVNIIRVIFIKLKFQIQPFSKGFRKAIIAAAICYILAEILPNTGFPVANIFYKGLLVTFLFGLITISWKISEDINELYHSLKKRFW